MKESSLVVVAYMALNFTSSVLIIWVNKWVFQIYEYSYGTTLTFVHFLATFIGLWICHRCGMFEIKYIRIRDVLPLSLAFCGFVVFNNMSLLHNAVGFYQLMKVMTTPTIVFIQWLLYGVVLPDNIKLSLVPICVGVLLASVTNVEANAVGTFYAVLGILSTSMYQIWVQTKQVELGVNSMQLLFYQAPMSAGLLVFTVPIFDDIFGDKGIFFYEYSFEAVCAIALSAILAFVVNLSIFLVIGKTSPISYNVLGHCKLCAILLGGFLFFGETTNGKNICGILLALVGIFWYTHLKLHSSPGKSRSSTNSRGEDKTGDRSEDSDSK